MQGGVVSSGYGKTKDGHPYRGLRIERVPADLEILALPEGAVITAVNGVPLSTTDSLQKLFAKLFPTDRDITTRRLMVEYVFEGANHAIEYRVL